MWACCLTNSDVTETEFSLRVPTIACRMCNQKFQFSPNIENAIEEHAENCNMPVGQETNVYLEEQVAGRHTGQFFDAALSTTSTTDRTSLGILTTKLLCKKALDLRGGCQSDMIDCGHTLPPARSTPNNHISDQDRARLLLAGFDSEMSVEEQVRWIWSNYRTPHAIAAYILSLEIPSTHEIVVFLATSSFSRQDIQSSIDIINHMTIIKQMDNLEEKLSYMHTQYWSTYDPLSPLVPHETGMQFESTSMETMEHTPYEKQPDEQQTSSAAQIVSDTAEINMVDEEWSALLSLEKSISTMETTVATMEAAMASIEARATMQKNIAEQSSFSPQPNTHDACFYQSHISRST